MNLGHFEQNVNSAMVSITLSFLLFITRGDLVVDGAMDFILSFIDLIAGVTAFHENSAKNANGADGVECMAVWAQWGWE
ncbi:unnamed protein product [Strongylus vulgaris]|uniref:Uncharacterized protein n=1 Tax=Strongylus vulgaris TaxID=40348 RepID=A0A3P7JAD9_STRVU|nr:unnamed protein product [Strongylus vulgaris]